MVRSLVDFCVRRSVPVTLLMWTLLIGGAVALVSMRREFFPETAPQAARIVLVYPGASPKEIEEIAELAGVDLVVEPADVALDPERYETLLDVWESAVGPLRAQADFSAPRLLDDPMMASHFHRAGEFLDRVDLSKQTDDIQSILLPRVLLVN